MSRRVALQHAVESYNSVRLLFVHVPESRVKPVHIRGKGLDTAFIPNNSAALSKVPLNSEPTVHMGRILDGVAAHVKEFPLKNRADVSSQAESSSIDIENILNWILRKQRNMA